MNAKSIVVRYGISTLGLVLASLGVGLSIKSNLGIAPLSCVPTVLSLRWPSLDFGFFSFEGLVFFTWAFNLLFIVAQAFILRKDFKWEHVLQVLPVFIFGYLIGAANWLFNAIEAPSTHYIVQILLCLASVVLTAVGIRLEIVGQGWILPADSTLNVICGRTKARFSTVKVIMDVTLVTLTAVLALIFFARLTGNETNNVIREGTVIQAILTGLCMKVTDPVIDRIFAPIVAKVKQ